MKTQKIALIGHPSSVSGLALLLRQVGQYEIQKVKAESKALEEVDYKSIGSSILICNARNVAPCCQILYDLSRKVSAEKIIVLSEVKDPNLMYTALDNGVSKFIVGRLEQIDLARKLKKEISTTVDTTSTRSILAIGAHPDDVEIGCGGTLKKHSERGDDVTILTLSKGAQGGNKEQRVKESTCAAKSLQSKLIMCDLVDTMMSNGGDTISCIHEAIERSQPDIIYTHSCLLYTSPSPRD